jgi:hypothetical protein
MKKFPHHLSIPVDGTFHKIMIDNELTKSEAYDRLISFGWTDELLVANKLLTEKPKVMTNHDKELPILTVDDFGCIIKKHAKLISSIESALCSAFGVPEHLMGTAPSPLSKRELEFWDFNFTRMGYEEFSEAVDKLHSCHKLKGGKKSDGTWYLSGRKK